MHFFINIYQFCIIVTSGAMRKSMMNFWQATPSEVLRSIGDGDADDAEHDEENDEFGRGDSPVSCGLRFRSPPVMGDCPLQGDDP